MSDGPRLTALRFTVRISGYLWQTHFWEEWKRRGTPMQMPAKRRRVHKKLAALPGVRRVRRPVSPGSSEHFDLYYVRGGRKSAQPLVIIPGGPGVASVQMYKGLR